MIEPMKRGLRWGYYLAFRARRGYGLPKTKERWEELYRRGRWDYLDSATELPHYMVAVGYTREFARPPSVLDVGCGHGRLLELLRAYPMRGYLGIDIAEEAIRRARRAAPPGAEFVVADYEEFVPEGPFDVILFNECLSYARDPAAVVHRYSGALAADGVIIVSMCYNWWQYPIWRTLEPDFETLHGASVTNEKGQVWHIRMLRARRARSARRSEDAAGELSDSAGAVPEYIGRRIPPIAAATARLPAPEESAPYVGEPGLPRDTAPLWQPVRTTALLVGTVLDDVLIGNFAERIERGAVADAFGRLWEFTRAFWPLVLMLAATAAAVLGLGAYAVVQLLDAAG